MKRTRSAVKPRPRILLLLGGVVGLGVFVGPQIHPASVLVAYFVLYLVSGLGESALLLWRWLLDRKAASLADVVDEDEDPSDDGVDNQEVLLRPSSGQFATGRSFGRVAHATLVGPLRKNGQRLSLFSQSISSHGEEVSF